MRTLVRLSQPPRLCFVVSGRGEVTVRVWENPKETAHSRAMHFQLRLLPSLWGESRVLCMYKDRLL